MNYSIVVMAAGLGSRYGSFKQIDSIGPNGEYLLEYSIYDALQSGFNEVILIVNEDVKSHLEKIINKKSFQNISFKFIVQKPIDTSQFGVPKINRTKPLGTGHIITILDEYINNPFCIINADDYYGAEAYRIIYRYLAQADHNRPEYFMVAYNIEKTLSDNGSVTRGICDVNSDNLLTRIEETLDIKNIDGKIYSRPLTSNKEKIIAQGAITSMNFWGFNPTIFPLFKSLLKQFILDPHTNLEKDEFYIPQSINILLQEKKATVKVEKSPSQWFGVTYKDDHITLKKYIHCQIHKGLYPKVL